MASRINKASPRHSSNFLIVIALISITSAGCMGIKKPWRDYTTKPFDSKEWLAGDKIDRGRMVIDLAKQRQPSGLTKEGVVEMLDEADLKKTIEGKDVWFYRVDIGIAGGRDLPPVSFDEKGRSSYGMAEGGTFSMTKKEADL